MRKMLFCFATLLFAVTNCQADVVNIDFGRAGNQSTGNINNVSDAFMNGVIGVADPDGDGVFAPNGVNTASSTVGLINDMGAASGYSIGVYTQNIPNDEIAEAGTGGDFAGPYPSIFSGIPQSALEDGLFLRDEDGDEFLHFVFSGLSATKLYDLRLYGARPGNSLTTFIDVTDGINGAVLSSGSYFPQNNSTELVFSGLAADANGELTLRVNAPGTSGSGTVNFIQLEHIEIVPEPSAAILISLLGLCTASRRRRR